MVIPRLILTAALVALLSAGITTAGITTGQDRPVFSAKSDLVVLHVTVKDKKGKYVTDLPEDAFVVTEDGRQQSIRFFAAEDSPVTVGLLIDSSSSMLPNRDRVIAAATAFAESSHPDDELFALAFNETVQPALPPDGPFTSSAVALRRAVTRVIHPRGRTALFDAIAAGLEYVGHGRHERKVLVVVSDGGDNASRLTFEDVLTKAEASNVFIYTMAVVDPLERDANPKLLKKIARATGGEAFAPANSAKITAVLQRIARDIRHAYTIGYVSSNETRDGSFRKIRVTVQTRDRRALVVKTREGYLAP
jgi:Ca-activated chloride channel family protein